MTSKDWYEVTLSEVSEIIGGGTPKTSVSEYWNGNIPWLSVVDFNNDNRLVFVTEKMITEKGLNNSSTKLLNPGDIIISARGTVGALAQLAIPMAFNQSCYGMRAKATTENDFLYYAIKNIISQIKANTHGSVFDTITRATFDNLRILLPSRQEQKAIAATLSCLDDKIELNNRINKTLEEMAQAIFKSWFVDFEPFLDGEFEDSELGRIPKGWSVGTLGDIAIIIMGQSPSGSSYNESKKGAVFYQGRTDFGFRFPTIRLYTTEPKRLANKGDLLLSVRAPVGDVNVAFEDCCIGRGLAALRSKNGYNSFLHYALLNLKDTLNIFNGEGTVFGSINKEALNGLKVIMPPVNVVEEFQNVCGNIDLVIENNATQARAIASIRDSLLPKLMSGEIRVPIEEVQ